MKISIIIPTLNEADNITAILESVFLQEGVYEVIVADGGSKDETQKLAAHFCTVISAPRGRALQMNYGAQEANGEALLFLHADSILHPEALKGLRSALNDARVVGGTFTMRFDHPHPLFRIYGALTHLPVRFLHFGDQGIFIRRNVFEQLNGYAEIGLMEDIDLYLRMRKVGRTAIVPYPITTSARRFLRHGLIWQQIMNIGLVALFLLGANPDQIARWYQAHKL